MSHRRQYIETVICIKDHNSPSPHGIMKSGTKYDIYAIRDTIVIGDVHYHFCVGDTHILNSPDYKNSPEFFISEANYRIGQIDKLLNI